MVGFCFFIQMNTIRDTEILVNQIQQELVGYADPVKKEILPKFFKTGKGQYAEGDCFLGVTVPNTRSVANRYTEASFQVVAALLQSKWHECRLCALLMLVARFKNSKASDRKAIYDFYLAHTDRINNWDLVDLSAPYIVGAYLLDLSREDLYRLAASSSLWEQRIAVVATLTLIRNGDFTDILSLAECLLSHRHDLIQKAVGWMLREMGKRNKDLLVHFLKKHSKSMPRTMLRYSIEKLSADERRYFMRR
ncbi:DNA alkylation repair enzyme [gut metagenome]|uniref:DNA alkylation repair enzyme n=1 Tax=gut metagenome TaxID=749906 RepID=J9G2A4_9ZZZZ